MSTIEVKGHPTPLSKYELWAVPNYKDTVHSDIETEHRPLATLDSKSTIYFDVKSGLDEYIQLDDIWLYMVIQVIIEKPLKAAVTIDDWDNISPTNYLLQSMFKQIDLIIGNRTVTHSLQTYPYKCDLETKLGKTKEARDSFLTAALWYEDDKDYTKIDEPNKKRASFFKPSTAHENQNYSHSNNVDLSGKLHLDMFEQEKPLPGKSTMRIKLIPNGPSF